jgi:hypothetical protein
LQYFFLTEGWFYVFLVSALVFLLFTDSLSFIEFWFICFRVVVGVDAYVDVDLVLLLLMFMKLSV